ncbi:MAG TPA: L,D-transpeptidase [Mycobacteriales bacterium]
MRYAVRAALAAALLVPLAACGGADPRAPEASPAPSTSPAGLPSRTPLPTPTGATFPAYAVHAKGRSVAVHDGPGGRALRTFANPQPSGAPLVFLLVSEQQDWLRVQLPARPNGSTGWVRRADVTLHGVPYRVDVLRGAHQLRLFEYGRQVRVFPVGIGTSRTPTPGGTFYLKELLQPPDPDGDYGPYAYGLSGYSNVLTTFNGGDGVIGIHGTNQPSSVGRDVSHGCIRMRNADITFLARILPLGTPVRILA